MSAQYDKVLSSDRKNTLKINIGGIKDNKVKKEDLKLSLYAFNTASGFPVFNKEMYYDDIVELYNYLNSISIIRDNTREVTNKFIELDEGNRQIVDLVVKGNSKLLHSILRKIESEEKQKILLSTLTNAELSDLSAAIKFAQNSSSLKALQSLIDLEESGNIVTSVLFHSGLLRYKAGQPEKIFQNWIDSNIWTLGTDYIKKHSARKIGINTISDVIMESTDGFIDLIELKLPSADIFSYDKSHKCHYPSPSLSLVLGQCLHYLKKLDDYKLLLEKEYKFKVLSPRIKIIIGRTHNFSDEKCEALRMLNSNLSNIQVISYDYLLACGNTILSYYKPCDK